MTSENRTRPIRLWPAWGILMLQGVAMILTVTPSINNAVRFYFMMLGPAICLLLFLGWLFFFSRLAIKERFGVFGLMLLLGFLATRIVDASMPTAVWIYGFPLAMLVTVLALHFRSSLSQPAQQRLLWTGGALALAFSLLALFRLDGFTGDYWPELTWRWAPTAEASLRTETVNPVNALWHGTDEQWPSFRGPERNGRVTGIAALSGQDLEGKEAWRAAVGPGWSSFAAVSGRLFTQEQRGEEEVISCYDAESGELIWRHGYPTRFTEVVSGPGPRATPTFDDGKLFTFGARAMLSALRASDGKLLWQRDLVEEVKARVPMWGSSSSPLVWDGLVIVYVDGEDDNGLMAFRGEDGEVAWRAKVRGMNYSSAQLVEFSGQEQILFMDSDGLLAFDPASGREIWRFKPEAWEGPPIVQAQQIGPSDLIAPLGDGIGTARLTVERTADGAWAVNEVWSSRGLKPSFSDFVYHEGYLYGFDQNIFACIDASTGERQWKRGRYGFGQVVLLADASQLLVMGEAGDVVLLAADPDEHRELGRFEVLDGKTWNHPIIAEGQLIVRNGTEMVSLDLG